MKRLAIFILEIPSFLLMILIGIGIGFVAFSKRGSEFEFNDYVFQKTSIIKNFIAKYFWVPDFINAITWGTLILWFIL